MNKGSEEIGKDDYQEDPSKKMDKGKSLHVFSAGNQVISHKIADRNDTAIKALHGSIQIRCAAINE
jgi:hypothetical protein